MPSSDERLQSKQFVTLDTLTAEDVTENGLSYGAEIRLEVPTEQMLIEPS